MVSRAQSIRFQIPAQDTSVRHARAFRQTGESCYVILSINDAG